MAIDREIRKVERRNSEDAEHWGGTVRRQGENVEGMARGRKGRLRY